MEDASIFNNRSAIPNDFIHKMLVLGSKKHINTFSKILR